MAADIYVVRRRGLSLYTTGFLFWRLRRPYKRPWELLRDGKPIGFYKTADEARDASPGQKVTYGR